jgi:hypothetical protein
MSITTTPAPPLAGMTSSLPLFLPLIHALKLKLCAQKRPGHFTPLTHFFVSATHSTGPASRGALRRTYTLVCLSHAKLALTCPPSKQSSAKDNRSALFRLFFFNGTRMRWEGGSVRAEPETLTRTFCLKDSGIGRGRELGRRAADQSCA